MAYDYRQYTARSGLQGGPTCGNCKHYKPNSENPKVGRCFNSDTAIDDSCKFFTSKR